MRATDAALLIVALAIAWSFYRAHRSTDGYLAHFNLLDLLIEGGRVSKIAFAFMATLLVTSWVVVRLTIEGKLTEGIFAAYVAAWIAPIVAKLFSPPPPTGTTTTVATQTVEKTVTP